MQLKHLPNIKSPQDIRNYSDNELRELCDEIRQYTIDTVTEIGGHLASTLGAVELTVAIPVSYTHLPLPTLYSV